MPCFFLFKTVLFSIIIHRDLSYTLEKKVVLDGSLDSLEFDCNALGVTVGLSLEFFIWINTPHIFY